MNKYFKRKPLLNLFTVNIFLISILFLISCKKEIVAMNVVPDRTDTTINNTTDTTTNISANKPVENLPASQSPQVALFDAALDTRGNLSAYDKSPNNPFTAMVINPDRISVVNDPVYGAKRKVMLMDVRIHDTGGVTENPRAQVQTPMSYVEGQTVYAGLSVRFTKTFWTYFLTFAEFYGAPYNGTSPFRLGIQGSNIIASSDNNGKQTNLWQAPMQANVWYDFVYREVLSSDPLKGSVQVWLRKQGETEFKEILSDTKLATITNANLLGPNYHKVACYYDKSNTFTDATRKTQVSGIQMYLTGHKIGNSFAMVAPPLMK